MIHYKKYLFDSKQEAMTYINNLGTFQGIDGLEYKLHNHVIVTLGFLPKNNSTYSDKYAVDVLWRGLEVDENGEAIYPEGWFEKELTTPTDYKHDFIGYIYIQ